MKIEVEAAFVKSLVEFCIDVLIHSDFIVNICTDWQIYYVRGPWDKYCLHLCKL